MTSPLVRAALGAFLGAALLSVALLCGALLCGAPAAHAIEIGEVAPRHASLMGSITAPGRLIRRTAPAVARRWSSHPAMSCATMTSSNARSLPPSPSDSIQCNLHALYYRRHQVSPEFLFFSGSFYIDFQKILLFAQLRKFSFLD